MFRAYAALIALGVIWGTNFIYMKWATELITPLQTVFLRVLFGFLPLAIVALKVGALKKEQLRALPHFIVMSLLATSLYYYGFVTGTSRLPTGVAGLLSGSIPIFTFICSWIFLRDERPTLRMAIGTLLGFLGIIVSARPWETVHAVSIPGVLWMLLGTLSLGVSFVYAKHFLMPLKIQPLALATWQSGLALISLACVTPFDGIIHVASNAHTLLGLIIGLGILGTGGSFLIYYYIIGKLGAVKASGGTYIAPVVALIISFLAGEDIGPMEISALILILGGVLLLQTGKAKASSNEKGLRPSPFIADCASEKRATHM